MPRLASDTACPCTCGTYYRAVSCACTPTQVVVVGGCPGPRHRRPTQQQAARWHTTAAAAAAHLRLCALPPLPPQRLQPLCVQLQLRLQHRAHVALL